MNSDVRVSNKLGLWERLQRSMADERTGKQIYLLAFAVFICEESLGTTMFDIPGRIYLCLKTVSMVLVIFKVICFDRYEPVSFWIMVCILAVGAAVFVSSGYTEAFLWICMVIGAKDVPFRKILQIYLIISVGIVLLAFSASLLNVIQNLQYTRDDGGNVVRNSFGIVYTTDFASHIFSIVLVAFYLLKDRLRVYHYVLALILAGLIYYFCYTRLDAGCIVLLVGVFAVVSVWKKRRSLTPKYRSVSKTNPLFIWSMPIVAAIMFVLSYFYTAMNRVMYAINTILNNRLKYGRDGLKQFGFTLFGQEAQMEGFGNYVTHVRTYFFVDCSYLYVFIRYGLLFLIIALAVYALCCKKYEKDPYFLAAVLVIAVNCMIAHHMVELAYSPFALAFLAAMPAASARGKWSLWEQSSG